MEAEEAEMGEAWQRVTKKSKSEMSFEELHSYYESKLRQVGKCPNRGCNCLAILSDGGVSASVVMYLCWFNRKTKYKQDALVFEWFKYAGMKRTKKVYCFTCHTLMMAQMLSLKQYASICFARRD